MNDLIRRALLGDRAAQEECIRQGIVLPCPCCGEEAKLKQLSGRWSVCCLNNCVGSRIYNDKQRALTTWNTRPAPPIDPKDLQSHGHWIEHPTGGLVCSHCDRYKPDEWRSMCCPNCGAILDGQVECDG